jgi:zinc transport system permease protein
LSLARGFNTNLFSYLFGSIVTVTSADVYTILCLGVVVIVVLVAFYKEILYVTFDEDAAQVSGINTRRINTILIVLAALIVSLSIPIVGVLLIGALIVIPVIAALQLRKNFIRTIIYAEIISIFSVVVGIIVSFYLDISAGGTIVLLMLAIFFSIYILKRS